MQVHETVKSYAASVGMIINHKKSAIQLSVETPLPESLQDIARMDERTYKNLGFEMKKGEVDKREMLVKLEELFRDLFEEPTRKVKALMPRT